jgi:hypothetical protein
MYELIYAGGPWSHVRVEGAARPADLDACLAALDEAGAISFPVLVDLTTVSECAIDTFDLARAVSVRLRLPEYAAFIVKSPLSGARLRQMLHGAGLSGAAEVFMSDDDAARWLIAAPALGG